MSTKTKKQLHHFLKVSPFHVLVWGLLFSVNYVFIKNYRITFDTSYHFLSWIIFILLFYLNYLLFMPYLFFKKRFILYIFASLILISGLNYAKRQLDQSHFEKIIQTEIQDGRMMHKPFPPEQMGPPPFDNRVPPPKPDDHRSMRAPRFSLYGLVLFYLASISLRFFNKWQNDEKLNREIEKDRISTELTFLKQQVNPHFLFNALNSIYSMTINTSDIASNTILKLSAILRYMLYETENRMVNLSDEINIIDSYIDLQKLRLPQNVSVNYHVTGNTRNNQIAPLLLIPLIENAFKHGVDNVNSSSIDIMISILDNTLELQIKNRIVQKNKIKDSDSGIGIKNIKRRLDLLYPEKYYFDIDERDGIFTVTLQIKLKE